MLLLAFAGGFFAGMVMTSVMVFLVVAGKFYDRLKAIFGGETAAKNLFKKPSSKFIENEDISALRTIESNNKMGKETTLDEIFL